MTNGEQRMANGLIRAFATRLRGAVGRLLAPPPTGRIAVYDPHLVGLRSALTGKLTFQRIESLLAAGKDGQLAETLQFFEEMEQKWGRLASVAATRRMALTRLEWEVVSAADDMETAGDKTLADEAAAYVRETLKRLKGFRRALKHLATSIGRNLAVVEIEWQRFEPVDIFPVYSERLTMQLHQSADVRIVTRELRMGIPAQAPKFITCIPNPTSGSPLWRSMAEGHAWLFLIWKLALSDWGTFCELFGIPFRHVQYPQGATPEEKSELKRMLETMGSTGYALTSSAVQLAFVESSARGVAPFEAILNWCNREAAVLYTGGGLPSDLPGGLGTSGPANKWAEVREDLRDDDIANESDCLGEQLIEHLCAFQFPGRDVPCPTFRRTKPETVDRTKEATAIRAAQGVGVTVGEDWARKRLAIPRPGEGENVLEPADAFVDAVREESDEATKPRSDEGE